MFAARQNDLASVKTLLDGGADVNLQSADGSTALLVAIINEHNELATYLLEHGADPNLGGRQGAGGVVCRDRYAGSGMVDAAGAS